MKRFVLDTGILVHYARQSSLYKQIESEQRLSSDDSLPIISVATYGEIMSFAIQSKWGTVKIKAVQTLVSKIVVIDINTGDSDLINAYAEIDAYSKNQLPGSPIGSAITMGKNDVWIAATAKVANATLITIDGDFDHLHNKFIQVKKY